MVQFRALCSLASSQGAFLPRPYLVDREEPRRRGNSHGVGVRSVGERHDAGTQKLCQPAEQQAEVVAGGGKDGVDAVALGSLEQVAAHAVLGLEMADNRLDGSAAPHLAADPGADPADLAGDPDPDPVRVIVAAIPLVDVDAAGLDASELLQIGNDGAEGMAVIGASVQRLGVEDELATLG